MSPFWWLWLYFDEGLTVSQIDTVLKRSSIVQLLKTFPNRLADGPWPIFAKRGKLIMTRWPISSWLASISWKTRGLGCLLLTLFYQILKPQFQSAKKNLVSKVTWCKDGAMPDATAELESLGDEKIARALPTPQAEPILARPLPMAPDWMENWRSASPILQNLVPYKIKLLNK